jgi:hypothetical protein
MKKIILLAILFMFSNFSYSQKKDNKPTRQQTEIWLSEKIDRYINKENYHSIDTEDKKIITIDKNIKFTLNDNSIIITYDVEKTRSNRYLIDGLEFKKENYTESVTIPLKNITNKVFINKGYLVFESNYESFVRTKSNGSKSTTSWFGLRIDAYKEEDFSKRFDKAMNHLLTFVEKSKTSETF